MSYIRLIVDGIALMMRSAKSKFLALVQHLRVSFQITSIGCTPPPPRLDRTKMSLTSVNGKEIEWVTLISQVSAMHAELYVWKERLIDAHTL